ncbi:MAG: exodeoxyribonuclease V alpha subunit [Lentimonas sp.]|jgi:exodeoxyribonuclease V alpha subunit
MDKQSIISLDLVRQLCVALRPLDLSLATKIYSGSALDSLPSVAELTEPKASIFWLAALTSYAQNQSHSGLSLDSSLMLQSIFSDADQPIQCEGLRLVDLVGTVEELPERYGERCVAAAALATRPLAIFVYRAEARLIYLNRWYQMEAELGLFFRERMARSAVPLPVNFADCFRRFFKAEEVAKNPWQAAACLTALRSDFAVITGGPGTGKTTTVTRLLCLLLSLAAEQRPLQVKMVAQTGKAAERMREAFNANLVTVLGALEPARRTELAALCEQRIDPASTIHQLLGYRGLSGFAHHAGNPVSCDLLIVDEATMVDLELYLKLFRALPAGCRIILLGDKNQLSAVDTGNVFSDLTTTAVGQSDALNVFSDEFAQSFEVLAGSALPKINAAASVLGDRVVELVKSYRFTTDSEVGRLATLLLESGRLPAVGEAGFALTTLDQDWQACLYATLQPYRAALQAGVPPAALLYEIQQTRVLCAVRSGMQGSRAINALLTESIFGNGQQANIPIHGLPILIVRNDKQLGLWNGDCGVFYTEPENGQLGAYFQAKAEGGPLRRFNPYALPEWEPAFALTIHKSQGSEYGSVVVVLPELKRNFVTWELVYTGITRGKKTVSLILPTAHLGQVLPRVARVSGLLCELGAPGVL